MVPALTEIAGMGRSTVRNRWRVAMAMKMSGALKAMLAKAELEVLAELEAEEREKRSRRAEVARANLAKARQVRQAQPAPAAHGAS
jgi:hypothetical protein